MKMGLGVKNRENSGETMTLSMLYESVECKRGTRGRNVGRRTTNTPNELANIPTHVTRTPLRWISNFGGIVRRHQRSMNQ